MYGPVGVRSSHFNISRYELYCKNERGEIRGMIDPKRKLNGDKPPERRESGTWTGVSRKRARRVLHNSIRYPRVPHPSPVLTLSSTPPPRPTPHTSTPHPLPPPYFYLSQVSFSLF